MRWLKFFSFFLVVIHSVRIGRKNAEPARLKEIKIELAELIQQPTQELYNLQ